MAMRYYGRMIRLSLRFLVLLPVHIYRLFVSPVLGPRCRFQPTCSEYALDAVKAHGVWTGGWLSAKRLGKCHPFHEMHPGHGFDPVPLEVCLPPWYAPWRVSSAHAGDETDAKQAAKKEKLDL